MIQYRPYIGTAGWSIPASYAEHFPESGTHLRRYAQRLDAVEINSSFYRPHRRATYQRWAESVPDDFRFAVKIPKTVTHANRLQNCGELVGRFIGEVEGLQNKLGVLLVQLPPSLVFDADIAAMFFDDLHGRIDTPIACEPRHPSWFTESADTCLKRARVARVMADPPVAGTGPVGTGEQAEWAGLAYFRLHGSPRIYYSDYDESALQAVRLKLEKCCAGGVPSWCIFDNTAAFAATGNALWMARAMSV